MLQASCTVVVTRELASRDFRPDALPAGRVPVLFTTDWCGYCRRFLPHFRRLGAGLVVDITDDDDPLWDTFGIRVVPTVLVFDGGKPVGRWEGALTINDADAIATALSS